MKMPFEKVRLWQTHFSVLRPFENLPVPELVVYEEQRSAAYRCDGRRRFESGGQLVITLQGRGAITAAGTTYDLIPGKAFLHNHNDPQICYFYPEDGTAPWQFLWIAFFGGNSYELTAEINRNYGYIFDVPLDGDLVTELLNYKNYAGEIQIISPMEGAAIVYDMFNKLCLPAAVKSCPSGSGALIGEIQSMINSAPGSELPVEKIAEKFNMSREHLSRIFVRETGIALHEYIIRIRLKMAVTMLLQTRLSSKEIADRCGWKDYSNFYRIFKRRVGYSPYDLRAQGIRPQI